jgi:replicative DNA helicase
MIYNLENLLIPIVEGNLNLIAGRPGMGKTTFATTLAGSIEKSDKKVLYISAQSNFVKHQDSVEVTDSLKKKFLSIGEIEERIRTTEGLEVLFIDGIESITLSSELLPFGAYREDEQYLTEVLRKVLRIHSLNSKLVIFLIGGISDNVETRFIDSTYTPSDIKWRSILEDYLDMIVTVFRFDFYGITTDDQGNDIRDELEVNIIKNRNGKNQKFKIKSTLPQQGR